MGLNSLWQNLEREWQDVSIDELQGHSIAIDGQIWLYESWRDSDSGLCNNYLARFHDRCKALLKLRIQPYIIFDQYQDDSFNAAQSSNSMARERFEMQFVRESRPTKVTEGARMRYGRNVTKMRNLDRVTELLDAMGVRYFRSIAVDNEAAGSFLEDQEKVIGFVSPDPDYFMYGGKHLYKIVFDDNLKVQKISKLSADSLMDKLGLNHGRLIAMGMLLGCDYWEKKMSGIGNVSAMEIVGAFAVNEDDHPCSILDRFRNYCDPTFNAKAEESSPRSKLKQAGYSFHDFNPSCDSFAEAVNAYMWPNLENLPYLMNDPAKIPNEKKVTEILSRKVDDEKEEEDSNGNEGRKSTRNKNDSSLPNGKVAAGVKRRASSITWNEVTKRRNVVMRCSRRDAIEWSKREWDAIQALRKAVSAVKTEEVRPSGRRTTAIAVNAK